MALLSGLRVISANEKKSEVGISFSYLTKNPFRSMYFACQSMAAEFSTAVICLQALDKLDSNFSFIVVEIQASFSKKATGLITFTCNRPDELHPILKECVAEDTPNTVMLTSIGTDEEGDEVAIFSFTWSFKPKG